MVVPQYRVSVIPFDQVKWLGALRPVGKVSLATNIFEEIWR